MVVVVVIVLVKVTVKVTLRVVMSKSTSISLMNLTERQGQETSLHNKIILIV